MRKEYLKQVHKNKVDENSPGYEKFIRTTKMFDDEDIESIRLGFASNRKDKKFGKMGKMGKSTKRNLNQSHMD